MEIWWRHESLILMLQCLIVCLTSERLKAIADDVRQVCHLEDPVGQVIDGRLLDSGLRLETPRSL